MACGPNYSDKRWRLPASSIRIVKGATATRDYLQNSDKREDLDSNLSDSNSSFRQVNMNHLPPSGNAHRMLLQQDGQSSRTRANAEAELQFLNQQRAILLQQQQQHEAELRNAASLRSRFAQDGAHNHFSSLLELAQNSSGGRFGNGIGHGSFGLDPLQIEIERRKLLALQEELQLQEQLHLSEQILLRRHQVEASMLAAQHQPQPQSGKDKFLPPFHDINEIAVRQERLKHQLEFGHGIRGPSAAAAALGIFGRQHDTENSTHSSYSCHADAAPALSQNASNIIDMTYSSRPNSVLRSSNAAQSNRSAQTHSPPPQAMIESEVTSILRQHRAKQENYQSNQDQVLLFKHEQLKRELLIQELTREQAAQSLLREAEQEEERERTNHELLRHVRLELERARTRTDELHLQHQVTLQQEHLNQSCAVQSKPIVECFSSPLHSSVKHQSDDSFNSKKQCTGKKRNASTMTPMSLNVVVKEKEVKPVEMPTQPTDNEAAFGMNQYQKKKKSPCKASCTKEFQSTSASFSVPDQPTVADDPAISVFKDRASPLSNTQNKGVSTTAHHPSSKYSRQTLDRKLSPSLMSDAAPAKVRYFNNGVEVDLDGVPVVSPLITSADTISDVHGASINRKTPNAVHQSSPPLPAVQLHINNAFKTTSSGKSKSRPTKVVAKKPSPSISLTASVPTMSRKSAVSSASSKNSFMPPPLPKSSTVSELVSFAALRVPELRGVFGTIEKKYSSGDIAAMNPQLADEILYELYPNVDGFELDQIPLARAGASYEEQLRMRSANCIRGVERYKKDITTDQVVSISSVVNKDTMEPKDTNSSSVVSTTKEQRSDQRHVDLGSTEVTGCATVLIECVQPPFHSEKRKLSEQKILQNTLAVGKEKLTGSQLQSLQAAQQKIWNQFGECDTDQCAKSSSAKPSDACMPAGYATKEKNSEQKEVISLPNLLLPDTHSNVMERQFKQSSLRALDDDCQDPQLESDMNAAHHNTVETVLNLSLERENTLSAANVLLGLMKKS